MDGDVVVGDGGVHRSGRQQPRLLAVLGHQGGEVGRFHIRDRVCFEEFLLLQQHPPVVSLRQEALSI